MDEVKGQSMETQEFLRQISSESPDHTFRQTNKEFDTDAALALCELRIGFGKCQELKELNSVTYDDDSPVQGGSKSVFDMSSSDESSLDLNLRLVVGSNKKEKVEVNGSEHEERNQVLSPESSPREVVESPFLFQQRNGRKRRKSIQTSLQTSSEGVETAEDARDWKAEDSVELPGLKDTRDMPAKRTRRGPQSRSSGYTGVTFSRTSRWEAHIW